MTALRIIKAAKKGEEQININLYHTATVKAVEKSADATFKLFGSSYMLFGENLYGLHGEDAMLLCEGWKEELKAVVRSLGIETKAWDPRG